MLNDIEVLDKPDDNYWMATAYKIPDTPHASIKPGETGFKSVPINRMVPRSFITNLKPGDTVHTDEATLVRGIAFGGDTGVSRVDVSFDGGETWGPAQLGRDEGKYSFRRGEVHARNARRYGAAVRCTNSNGTVQPNEVNWNPSGFMRNVIETTTVISA